LLDTVDLWFDDNNFGDTVLGVNIPPDAWKEIKNDWMKKGGENIDYVDY
jgi:hypothetical protein